MFGWYQPKFGFLGVIRDSRYFLNQWKNDIWLHQVGKFPKLYSSNQCSPFVHFSYFQITMNWLLKHDKASFKMYFTNHYRDAPIKKRRPWKLGYPLGFASSNKVSKTTAIFRCRQNSERRICNFSVSHLWADNTDTIEGLTIVLKCRNAGFIGKGFRAWST